jgi:hypothetical protein
MRETDFDALLRRVDEIAVARLDMGQNEDRVESWGAALKHSIQNVRYFATNHAEELFTLEGELEAELAASKAQSAQLAAALEPFAKLAEGIFTKNGGADELPDKTQTVIGDKDYIITVGHLRTALAAWQQGDK